MKQLSLFNDEEWGLKIGEERNGYKLVRNSLGIIQRISIKSRLTQEEFITRAKNIWGDQYDYSESVYIGGKKPITIFCKKHQHYFTVPMAQNHIKALNPTGCDKCMEEKLGWRTARGPHHRRTPEEKAREEEEKKMRKAEREQRRRGNSEERKLQRQMERESREKALIDKYGAKSYKEAIFIEKLIEKYGDIYGREFLDYQDRQTPVILVCPEHGPFKIKPRVLLTGENGRKPHGCWECYGLVPPEKRQFSITADEFFAKMKELYGDKYDFSKSEFKGISKPIKYYCHKHNWQISIAKALLDGSGCPYCSGRKFWWPDFERLAREKHGDKYDYSLVTPQERITCYVTIICPKHGPFKQRADLHLLGYGCRDCVNYPNKKTPEQRCPEWIDKCIAKYGEGRYDYSRAHEDYVNNDSVVWIRCCIHDQWFQTTPDNNLRTTNGSCPICSLELIESEGERVVRRWLEVHNIEHETQHQLPNNDATLPLQFLVADFYLPDVDGHPAIIEYNGQQHYEDIDFYYHNQRFRSFEVQQHRDRYLRQYCSEHQIRLLEIPYTDFDNIDTILTEFLCK